MEKAELLKKIDELCEVLKDYNKFLHLFSKDEGERTLAKTNELMGRIRWLLAASDAKDVIYPDNPHLKSDGQRLVKIRPCGVEYGNKTYMGILLGELAGGASLSLDGNKIKLKWAGHNPAIFVPDLNKIIFGYESWWSEIKSTDDFKEISNGDIENTWYVKLFREIGKSDPSEEGAV